MRFDKPLGYDEVEAGGEYTPIELGGHKLVIKQIEEIQKDGYSYLKVSFDTAQDDVQPYYYTQQYKNDTRDTKKWGGVATIFPTDREGKTSKTFKQFCTSIEKSNKSKISWGDGFSDSIVGKTIGGIFGEEEYLSNGEVKTARKLFWWRSTEGIKDADIPKKRTVEKPASAFPTDADGFMDITDGIDEEELPFN